MSEATNHRAEAERILRRARSESRISEATIPGLLTGILHALLALGDPGLSKGRTAPWRYDPKSGTAWADLGPQKVTFTAFRTDQCGAVWNMPDAQHQCCCRLQPGHMDRPSEHHFHLCQTGEHASTDPSLRQGHTVPPVSLSED